MVYNRKAISPWSVEREAGIESATVDSNIEVPQYLQPVVDTGFIDEKGFWKGNKSSDKEFIAFRTDEAIANAGTFLTPSVNANGTWPLDMTGYNDLFFAIKPTNGGSYAIASVMGPDSVSFANLNPVNAAANLKGTIRRNDLDNLLFDTADTLTADVWNIFIIVSQLKQQKLLQFSITNNSGGISTIETAYMRLI